MYFKKIVFTFKIIIILFTLTPVSFHAQSLAEYYKMIKRKLDKDEKFLYLYSAGLNGNEFKMTDILLNDSTHVYVKSNSDNANYVYNILFIKDAIGIDDIIPIRLIEVKSSSSKSLTGNENEESKETKILLDIEDFVNFYYSDNKAIHNQYLQFTNYISSKLDESTLQNQEPSSPIQGSAGYTEENNNDFIEYSRNHDFHKFPDKSDFIENKGGGIVKGGQAKNSGSPLYVDLDFSKVSFSHIILRKAMNQFGNIGFQVGFFDNSFNFLSYESHYLNIGTSVLFNTSGAVYDNLENDFFIKLDLNAKLHMNTQKLVNNSPFLSSDTTRLNVNSGISLNVETSKFQRLPIMNFYFSSSSNRYDKSDYYFNKSGQKYAYFSSFEWQYFMSFFWNTGMEKTSKFRFDIGFGQYKVTKVFYVQDLVVNTADISRSLIPLINIHYDVLNKKLEPITGLALRLWDSRLRLFFYLKVLKISDLDVRFETAYMLKPFNRSYFEWENKSNSLFQLRFRYGF